MVATTLLETMLVETSSVETRLVETMLVESAFIETALVETPLKEIAVVETVLVGDYLRVWSEVKVVLCLRCLGSLRLRLATAMKMEEKVVRNARNSKVKYVLKLV